jgi:hypothetical protein
LRKLITIMGAFALFVGWYGPHLYGIGGGGGVVACTGTAGTQIGDTRYNVGSTEFAYLMEVDVSAGCQADTGDEICAGIDDWSGTYIFYLMVYDSDGGSGEPGTRLDYVQASGSGSTMTQVCENLTQSITFNNSTAWVGFLYDGPSTTPGYNAATTTGVERRYIDSPGSTPPATWNAAGDTHNTTRDIDAYITFN